MRQNKPTQHLNIVVSTLLRMYDSNIISLHISGHTSEQPELSLSTAEYSVHCEHIWTGWQPVVGCCRGCGLVSGAWRLFIHKPGGNCKWKHRHLTAYTIKDHIVLFLCKEQQGMWESNIDDVFYNSLKEFIYKSSPYSTFIFMTATWPKT